MTFAIGFIFSDIFPRRAEGYDPLAQQRFSFVDWEALKWGAMAAAPGVVLHELAHKFLALSFGLQATFHAAYFWLIIGVALKLARFPFIFFVPGYVSYLSIGTPMQHALIALAGPATNLALWLGSWYLLKQGGKKFRKYTALLYLNKQINMFLFIFNMIPIPPFDGGQVFSSLMQAFSS